VAILVVVLVVFGGALSGEILAWDDDTNFTANQSFRGLGGAQVRWAFTTFLLGVYQPLSWLLFELQYVLFDLRPFGYHLTSLLLHALDTALVYRLVERLLARSATAVPEGWPRRRRVALAVALLWCVHPLRAEVVSWLSCQPYLLCSAFALSATLAYLRAADSADGAGRWRLASLALYLAALLAKAEAIMLPAALLCLDVYPLRRLGAGRGWFRAPAARRVWLEKIPFFALAAGFAVITLRARLSVQHVVPLESAGPGARIAHAAISVWFYLGKTVAPTSLSPYYPLPADLGQGLAAPTYAAAAVAAVAATVAIVLGARRWPALGAAWIAYLAFLLPHAGFVRIGAQLATDRYTYLSSVGFAAALAGGLASLADVAARRVAVPSRRRALGRAVGAGVALLGVLLAVGAAGQTSVWESSERLWSSAYARGGDRSGHIANNWGAVLIDKGRWAEAAEVLEQAVRLGPRNAKAHQNLSGALLRTGRTDAALEAARKVVELRPNAASAHLHLGIVLETRGDRAAAAGAVDRAAALAPDDAQIWAQRGQIYVRLGDRRVAEESLDRARLLDPGRPAVKALERELRLMPAAAR
jgi:Flp pilus assembly protein TadD